jgi:hypothetical protein
VFSVPIQIQPTQTRKEADLNCFHRGSGISIYNNAITLNREPLGRSMIGTTLSRYNVLETMGEGAIRRDQRYVIQSF